MASLRADGSARRTWWTTFGLLVLACGAWSLALPLSTGPDERDHAIRAASVTRGEIIGQIPTDPPRRNLSSLELNATSLVTVPGVYDHAARASSRFLGEARELPPSWSSSLWSSPGWQLHFGWLAAVLIVAGLA